MLFFKIRKYSDYTIRFTSCITDFSLSSKVFTPFKSWHKRRYEEESSLRQPSSASLTIIWRGGLKGNDTVRWRTSNFSEEEETKGPEDLR